jgi:ATP/ADP translocase
MAGLGLPELILIAVMILIIALPASRICAKAGYTAWLGVLVLVPPVSVLLLFFLAFVEWPIERQLQALRQGAPGRS